MENNSKRLYDTQGFLISKRQCTRLSGSVQLDSGPGWNFLRLGAAH
jgi:hypothetical protein